MPLLQRLPPERVLLETDGPFARSGSRPAVPADLLRTLDHLARLWAMTTDEARRAVVDNEQRLRCTAGESPPA
ncbi:TatD family hydrolase [Lentzea albidocapillata]|uniref:TatD family hydrolase n=1 Tax=Lentzea albidocapillata TaxID=40571 RepID=UPI0011836656